MNYKVGDVVRIVRQKSSIPGHHWNERMFKYLGSNMTIRDIEGNVYKMIEDYDDTACNHTPGWNWFESMIEGLVEASEEYELNNIDEDKELNDFFIIIQNGVINIKARCL